MFRLTLSTATLALVYGLAPAAPALADGAALLLTQSDYRRLDDVRSRDDFSDVARPLGQLDFAVTDMADADSGDLEEAFADFVQSIDGDTDRVAVLLSGRFVHSATETYLLSTDADLDDEGTAMATGLAMGQVMAVLGSHPGSAVLVLGVADPESRAGRFLTPGLGEMDIPQGVTVIAGPPQDAARFARRDLFSPGRDLTRAAQRLDLDVMGYAPRGMMFLADAAAAPQVVRPAPAPDTRAQDDRLWREMSEIDTEEAYRRYLSTYPQGRNADTAQERIEAIRSEPNRNARLREEALELNRDARRDIQQDLSLLGFNTRGVDGIFGPGTRSAVTEWQKQNGFEATSYVTDEQIARLDGQAARRSAELEEEARVRQEAEERRDNAFWSETGAAGTAAGLAAYLDRYPDGIFAEEAQEQLARLEEAQRAQAAAEDRRAWDEAVGRGTREDFERYIQRNPQGAFVDQARAEIAQLSRPNRNEQVIARAKAEEQALGLNRAALTLAEDRLKKLGFKPGLPDGKFNEKTRRALRRYQASRDLAVTGFLDQATAVRLLAESLR